MAYRNYRRSRLSSNDSDDEFYASECVREALEKAKSSAELGEYRIEMAEKLQKYMKDVEQNPDDDERLFEEVYRDIQDLPGLPEYIINRVRDANVQALGTPEVEVFSKEPSQDGDSDVDQERIRSYVRPHHRVTDLRYNNNNNYEPSETSVTSINDDEPYYVVREVIELDNTPVSDVSDVEECPLYDQYARYARRPDYLYKSVENLPTYSPRDCPLGPSLSDTFVTSPTKYHRSNVNFDRYMTEVPEWLEDGRVKRNLRPRNQEQYGETDAETTTKEKLDSFFTIEKLKAEVVRLQNTIKSERVDAFEKAQKFSELGVEALKHRIALLDGQLQEEQEDKKALVSCFEDRYHEQQCLMELMHNQVVESRECINMALSEKVKTTGKLGRKLNHNVLKAHQQVTESQKSVHLLVKKIEHMRQLIMKQQMYIVDLEKAFLDRDDWRIDAYFKRLDSVSELVKHCIEEGQDIDDIEEKIPKWAASKLPRRPDPELEDDVEEVRFANISEVLGQDTLLATGQTPTSNCVETFYLGEYNTKYGKPLLPPRRSPFYTPWTGISYLTHLKKEASRPRKVYEEPEERDWEEPEREHYGNMGVEESKWLKQHMQGRMSQYNPQVVLDGEWPTPRDYDFAY